MIIVYFSIALAVAALVYLGVSAFRTFKAIQPAMKSLSGAAADVQQQMEDVKSEADALKQKADHFKNTAEEKKQLVQSIGINARWSVEELKSLWALARMVPNPKKTKREELPPEMEKLTDRIVDLFGWWRKRRMH